jgi:hypothetical protein
MTHTKTRNAETGVYERRFIWSLIGALGILAIACPLSRAQRPPSVCLLPEDTLLFASVLDVPDTRERFSRTAFGGILSDSSLQPVVVDILRRFDEATAPLRESVGLTVDDLLNIPQGELTLALIAREEGEPAPVVLIDTGDHIDKAARLVRAVVQRIEEAGNTRSGRDVLETPITIFESVGRDQQDIAFFKRENTLVWSNDVGVLEKILKLWGGDTTTSLATRSDFSSIMQRSRRHNPKPQIIWYINPLAIFEQSSRDRLDMQVAMMMIPTLGLDGIKAVGGAVELDAGPYDSLWHAHLVLDTPRKGIVDMVRPKQGKMTPPDWAPADASDYLTIHWDLPATIDTLRTLYDSFRGEGALDEFVATRMSAPLGVDLLSEVLPLLTGRLTFMRWIEKPVAQNSEGSLFAIEFGADAAPGNDDIADSHELLRYVVQKHAARFMRHEFAGVVYYELIQQQPSPDQMLRRRRSIPCFGIVGDSLIIADRESLLKTVAMTQAGGLKRLAEAKDFESTIAEIDQLTSGSSPVMVQFQRPAERTEAWYESLRQRQNQEQPEEIMRRPRRGPFQGFETTLQKHPLPPFESLRKYFPSGGAVLLEDESGLHYTGFTLKRE